jgi:hypothetical protein
MERGTGPGWGKKISGPRNLFAGLLDEIRVLPKAALEVQRVA